MSKVLDDTQNAYRTKLEKFLADKNIAFNGPKPWDIKVYDSSLYERMLTEGSIGFGEAYMDGWWDCDQLDELFHHLCTGHSVYKVKHYPQAIKNRLWAYFTNRQSKSLAAKTIKRHYDLGNDLYRSMLGKHLAYSCGYWQHAKTLDQAQEHKFDLICRKLNLQPGQRLLDIGCGWGEFMKYAVENYAVACVGITLSEDQYTFGKAFCANLPIEIRLADYRELDEIFDHIVSIGMFEHVGYKNYNEFIIIVRRCLQDEGLFLLHTIGGNKSVISVHQWLEKYIFPGGMLPSIKQISNATEGQFVMEDWHNFGSDYDKTLMCWYENFSTNWKAIQQNYDDRFFRMWEYYLLSCAGGFRARSNQLWQIVFSKNGVPGGYHSVR
jgi:cyclopropane-fatty-acyl-phospholipid synthase